VVGVELSEKAIKAYFDQCGKDVTITCKGPFDIWKSENIIIYKGDYFDLKPDHLKGVKAVFDRAALIALKPEMRKQYVQHCLDIGLKGAQVLLITLEYDQTLKNGPPFSVVDDEVNELYQAGSVALLQESDVLDENQNFKNSGHPYLIERVYQISL
jgi:thiopurine S-methyltransferase